MTNQLTGAMFKQMVLYGAAAISAQKQAINDLNVFPVPDGDTGTNMSMSINTAAADLKKNDPKTLEQAAAVTASSLLRGARGNSGVILSLLFRGLSKGLKGKETCTGAELAAAMQEGVASAYKAVMKPAEGTVLTVSRLAAKRACEAAAETDDIEAMLAETLAEGYATLEQTIDMNPVLKKAGVVDAGGKGYLLILEGMLAYLRGEPMVQIEEEAEVQKNKADFNAFSLEEITFAFDTVFIVRKPSPDLCLDPLRTYLNSIGDSLVIGEDDEAFKVHVHTNIPGDALTEAQKYGTLELAKIENMRTQYEDVAVGKEAQSVDDLDCDDQDPAPQETGHIVAQPEKKYGFLAVCAGDGLEHLFRDLGVDAVVSGGQTMNPSTESILDAIDSIPAEVVFVLPNNSNIIMAAQQCVDLSPKQVVVIPSKTVPQGVTAMMNVDFEAAEAQEIEAAMTGALKTVATAQVTYAARNSDFDGFEISEGDFLALLEGKLFGTDREIDALLQKLADTAAEKEAGFISIFYGEDVSEDSAKAAAALFESACPEAEISVLPGGQPVYYYIISIE